MVTQLNSQDQTLETESVTLENLFTFIVDHFEEDGNSQNITFLIKTYKTSFSEEDKFVLKQTFKLLSKRLNEDDYISIATYNHYSGIALGKTPATELKKFYILLNIQKKVLKLLLKMVLNLHINTQK